MPPSRREVLQTITATAPVGLAGCLYGGASAPTDSSPGTDQAATGEPTSTSSPTTTPPPTPETTPPEQIGGGVDAEDKPTYKRVQVGSREGVNDDFNPHDIFVWNSRDGEKSVAVRILDRIAESTVHRAEYTIPAGEDVKIRLLTPSKYYVQLWGPAVNSPQTLLVPCERFDCNYSSTIIGIFEGGEVRATILTTLAACPGYEC